MHDDTTQRPRRGRAGAPHHRLAAVAVFGLGLAGSATANAAAFEAKTMRESLSAREVERPLILGKGWVEFGLGTDVKAARGAWDADGEKVDWSEGLDGDLEGARWLYTTQRLAVRYGVTRRGELYWTMKTHYVNLTNDQLDTDISQFGLGDPRFGYKYELFRSVAPLTSAIIYADYKAPAGNESPGNYIGGPTTFSAVIMTTGTPDAEIGLRGKRQVGPIAVELGAAYVHRFSNVVQYVIENELNQFSGRIKPGNITKADASLTVGLGPLALNGGALFQQRAATRVGATSGGLFPAKNLVIEEGSDGWSLDATAGATFNVTRGVDLVAGALIPVRGEDLMYFPIEDIHPTRGVTYSGTVEFRY